MIHPSSVYRFQLFACFAKSSFAFLVCPDCFVQSFLPEIGPQCGCDKKLGVGDLPKKEVADAELAAGADQQLRIWDAGSLQIVFKNLLIYFRGFYFAAFYFFGESLYCFCYLPPAAVAQRHNEGKAGIVLGFVHCPGEVVLAVAWEVRGFAYGEQPHLVFHQRFDLGA